MSAASWILLTCLVLLPAGDEVDNPWQKEAPAVIRRAEERSTVAALQAGLDAAWRADHWQAGLRLARRALDKYPDEAKLHGAVIRALWRAGRVQEAERLAAQVATDTTDRVALRALIVITLARGQLEDAARWGARLEQVGAASAEDWHHVYAARFAAGKLEGLPELLHKLEAKLNPKDGYPTSHMVESVEGLAAYLEAVGPAPLNQVKQCGAAPLTPLVLLNLPSCDVLINGRGPYRMVLDTGGSIMIALDQTVADEIGLKSVAKASVRGVSGKQETGQVLIDELRIGGIVCRRVVTRTFDVRSAIMNAADGILGTGIFADARMKLDFIQGQLTISPSRDAADTGAPADLRLVGDAKLMALVQVQDEPGVALLDTGADAVALAPSSLKRFFPERPVQRLNLGIGIGVGTDQTAQISVNSGVKFVLAGRTFARYGGLGLDMLDDVLGPVLGLQADALVGMPTFREMRSVTVDFPKCRMWIEWLPRD
jgi:predicted aspartyl protease